MNDGYSVIEERNIRRGDAYTGMPHDRFQRAMAMLVSYASAKHLHRKHRGKSRHKKK